MAEKRDAGVLEDRRHRAVALYRRGIRQSDIARKLGVTRQSVCRWVDAFVRKGPGALRRKPRAGRPPKLTAAQRAELIELLSRGAEEAGYSTQLWTAGRIRRLAIERFKVRFHTNHIPKLLQRCGWSFQRPRGRALERNEAAVQQWVAVEWPRIKKKPDAKMQR
jgi:transposase